MKYYKIVYTYYNRGVEDEQESPIVSCPVSLKQEYRAYNGTRLMVRRYLFQKCYSPA